MPIYSFKCDEEDGGCGHQFEVSMEIKNYKDKQKCPICKKIKPVHRDYLSDPVNPQVRLLDSEIKSVGHLAGRNRDKMSDEQIDALNRKNTAHLEERRLETNSKLLPGMKRIDHQKAKEKLSLTPQQRKERSKELREKAKEAAAKRKDDRKPPTKLKPIG